MAKVNKEQELREKAEEKIEELKDKVQEYQATMVNYIKKNPISAVVIAAASGILIGAFWQAMRCKK